MAHHHHWFVVWTVAASFKLGLISSSLFVLKTFGVRAFVLPKRARPALIDRLFPSFVTKNNRNNQNRRTRQKKGKLLWASSKDSISSSSEEEDLERWERMYMEGERKKSEILKTMGGVDSDKKFQGGEFNLLDTDMLLASPIRVVSLDLDNTIWKTGPTIQAANDALAHYLQKEWNVTQDIVRTEKIMYRLFSESKSTYAPPILNDDKDEEEEEEEVPSGPVYLTQLRKDALCHIYKTHVASENQNHDDDKSIMQSKIDLAFQHWTNARHESIQHNLANNVVETLQYIRSLCTTNNNNANQQQHVLMGAITDGNSNPRAIQILEPYFDFVVNAEQVGVSKPNARIFLKAIQEVVDEHSDSLQDVLGKRHSDEQITLDMAPEIIGPWWVHIGDDFVKDIVAAKNLRMRTIWTQEFNKINTNKTNEENNQPAKKKKSVKQLLQEFSERAGATGGIIYSEMNSEDFLARSIQQDFVDATVESFDEIAVILSEWHREGLESDKRRRQQEENYREENKITAANIPDRANLEAIKNFDFLDYTMPDQASSSSTTPNTEKEKEKDFSMSNESTKKTKFCVFCGEKIIFAAKFCSSCGGKQPQL